MYFKKLSKRPKRKRNNFCPRLLVEKKVGQVGLGEMIEMAINDILIAQHNNNNGSKMNDAPKENWRVKDIERSMNMVGREIRKYEIEM